MPLEIISPYAPLYCRPCPDAERDDEAWFGQAAHILEELPGGWRRVRLEYGYESYLEARHLGEMPPGQRAVVRALWADVLEAPCHQSRLLLTLPRGSRVHPLGEIQDWMILALPGGRQGYMKALHLSPLPQPEALEEARLRFRLVEEARGFLGVSYRWGGRTPAGMDCSGLCHTAYLLQGISIYRNARLMPGYPVREISAGAIQAGDLLYFPGHIAMYTGEGRFIHASGRQGKVCIASLNPGDSHYDSLLAQEEFCAGSVFPL